MEFLSISKKHSTVNNHILLSKLYHYDIRGTANAWFSSYLSSRNQRVVINGVSSYKSSMTCGVPQGSILGPHLLLLYINDTHMSVQSSIIHHFADDTNLLYSDRSIKHLGSVLNKDLSLLYDWLCANRLSLNASKTEFMHLDPLVNR